MGLLLVDELIVVFDLCGCWRPLGVIRRGTLVLLVFHGLPVGLRERDHAASETHHKYQDPDDVHI